jgi:hypothetical protein
MAKKFLLFIKNIFIKKKKRRIFDKDVFKKEWRESIGDQRKDQYQNPF